jgi:hypothetical protein
MNDPRTDANVPNAEGGFELLSDDEVTFTEPDGEAMLRWALAQR